jgi:hypothetical protein
MTNQHPITPPPNKLVDEWGKQYEGHMPEWVLRNVAADAARWGADRELNACCEWLSGPCPSIGNELRDARRPKEPSYKELAIALIDCNSPYLDDFAIDIIRRALEQLDD